MGWMLTPASRQKGGAGCTNRGHAAGTVQLSVRRCLECVQLANAVDCAQACTCRLPRVLRLLVPLSQQAIPYAKHFKGG